MKNVWKGLIIGALTGAGIGLLVDLLEALSRGGKKLSIQARDEASHLATVAEARVKDADLPEKAKHAAEVVSELVADKVRDTELSDVADAAKGRAKDVAGTLADTVRDTDALDRAKGVAGTVADKVKDTDVLDRAKDAAARLPRG